MDLFYLQRMLFAGWLAAGLSCLAQPSTGPGSQGPVAVIDGQAIYEKDLTAAAPAQVQRLRNQEYELKQQILESLINKKLVDAEANKRGIPAEKLLEQEVDSQLADPTESELEAYYLGQRERLNRPFDDVKSQLRQSLKQARTQDARQRYLKSLREKAEVAILMKPPRIEVDADPARVRGNPSAPVTIVEFSDFQCPFCQRVQATLKELLAKYDGRVKLSFRDFPLAQIHPRAHAAAQAARCAGEQGKFWEYHDLLFDDISKLDAASLASHAGSLGLDQAQFDACLSSGKFKASVDEDLEEGNRAGVSGTPGFFINGVFLGGAQPASAFEKIIEAELAAAGR